MSLLRDGAIKYVSMENWMAYTGPVVLNASPGVNIIASANGCGKSAIVCAIALSLGFDLNVLSRGDNIRSFIKRGCMNSTLKIGLVDSKSDEGVIHIERRIVLTDNKSKHSVGNNERVSNKATTELKTSVRNEWNINGKHVNLDTVKKLHKKLNIQVNNLVTFLAQANVGKFAAMTQHELFRSTLNAIDSELIDELEVLIDQTDQLKCKKSEYQSIEQELNSTTTKLSELQVISDTMLKFKDALLYRNLVKLKLHQLKQSNLTKGRKATLTRISNYKDEIKNNEKDHKTTESNFKRLQNETRSLLDSAKAKLRNANKIYQLDTTVVCVDNISNELDSSTDNKLDKAFFDSLTKLKSFVSDYRVGETQQTMSKEDIEKLQNKQREIDIELNNIKAKMISTNDLVNQIAELRISEETLRYKLQKLRANPQRHFSEIQYESLLSHLPFLKRERFNNYMKHCHERGFKPQNILINDIKVCGLQNCCIIEDAIGKYLECFIIENVNDKTMSTLLKDYRLPMITTPNIQHKLCRITKKMREFGVVAFLHEMVECSPVTKQILSSVSHLNETFLVDKDFYNSKDGCKTYDDAFYDEFYRCMIDEISHQLGRKVNTLKYYVGEKRHMYKQFQGNSKLFTDTEMTIHKVPRILVDCTQQNTHAKSNLQEINDIQNEIDTIVSDLSRLSKKLTDCNNSNKSLTRNLYTLTRKRVSIENTLKAYQSEKGMSERDWKTALEGAKSKHFESMSNAIIEQSESLIKWLSKSATIRTHLCDANKIYKKYCTSSGQLKHAQEIFNSSKAKMDELKSHLQSVENILQEQENKLLFYSNSINELQTLVKINEEICDNTPIEDERKQFERRKEYLMKLDSLNECELERELARADEQVKQLEQDDCEEAQIMMKIQEVKLSKKSLTQNLATLKESIEKMLADRNGRFSKWFEKIDSIVRKIDSLFGKYMQYIGKGSAGQVRLDLDIENIKEAKIRILVKFEKGRDLLPLTTSYQSGGERGITTMVYIISVQSFTNNGFFVIDEINQGLDSQYERRLMSLLLDDPIDSDDSPNDTTDMSSKNSNYNSAKAQYFILTPQLVPGTDLRNATLHFPLNGPGVYQGLSI